MTRLSNYLLLVRSCTALLMQEKRLFLMFVLLAVVGALTEGLGVTMLVPLLDATGSQKGLQGIPVIGRLAGYFAGFEPNVRLQMIALAILVLVLVRGAILYAVDVLANLVPLRLQARFSARSYEAFMRVRIGYLHERDAGALNNGVTEIPTRVSQLLIQFAIIVWNLLVLCVMIGLMAAVSLPMALGTVGFLGAVSFVVRGLANRHLSSAGARMTRVTEDISSAVHETLNGMRQIRLASAEELMAKRFSSLLDDKLSCQSRIAAVTAIPGPLFHTVAGVFICVLLVVNALFHEPGDTSWVGGVLVFLFLLFRLVGPFQQLNRSRGHIVADMQAFEELKRLYVQTAAERQPDGTRPVSAIRDGIALDRVSFTYPGSATATLSDLSLSIRRNEMVALVGPSGAGKSTLVNILTRLYDPDSGTVRVDGTDLRELMLTDWRRRIGVVSQDLFLFNATVACNIAFPQTAVSDEEVRRAAAFAAATDFIEAMPDGFETLVGDRGVRLSGGQQQRLAIARAVLSQPDLLILDEATSHLDSVTESVVQKAIETLRKDCALLVIAHRLSTIRKADRIVVLQGGRIAEEGTHAELLSRRGVYHDMLAHQQLGVINDDMDGDSNS